MNKFKASIHILRYELICVFLLIVWTPYCYASRPGPPPGKRIIYKKDIPASIADAMPKGAQSCFLGYFRLSSTEPKMLVHLYNEHPIDPKQQPDINQYTVAIYTVTQNRNKQYSYQLINEFSMNYKGLVWSPTTFGAQLLWLDPSKHDKPIIKFDLFSPDTTYGEIGNNILAVFSHGIKNQPVIQSFDFGSWRASESLGQDNYFDTVDANGTLEVKTIVNPSYDMIPPTNVLSWMGTGFFSSMKAKKDAAAKQEAIALKIARRSVPFYIDYFDGEPTVHVQSKTIFIKAYAHYVSAFYGAYDFDRFVVMSITQNGKVLKHLESNKVTVEPITASQIEFEFNGDKPGPHAYSPLCKLDFNLQSLDNEYHLPTIRITWHSFVAGIRVTSTALYNRKDNTIKLRSIGLKNNIKIVDVYDLYSGVTTARLYSAAMKMNSDAPEYSEDEINKIPVDGCFDKLLKYGCTKTNLL